MLQLNLVLDFAIQAAKACRKIMLKRLIGFAKQQIRDMQMRKTTLGLVMQMGKEHYRIMPKQ